MTPEEADILHKAEQSRLRSINVDEFDFDAHGGAGKKSSTDTIKQIKQPNYAVMIVNK